MMIVRATRCCWLRLPISRRQRADILEIDVWTLITSRTAMRSEGARSEPRDFPCYQQRAESCHRSRGDTDPGLDDRPDEGIRVTIYRETLLTWGSTLPRKIYSQRISV